MLREAGRRGSVSADVEAQDGVLRRLAWAVDEEDDAEATAVSRGVLYDQSHRCSVRVAIVSSSSGSVGARADGVVAGRVRRFIGV